MDDSVNTEAVGGGPVPGEEVAPEESGATAPAEEDPASVEGDVVDAEVQDDVEAAVTAEVPDAADAHPDTVLAAERLADLQRLQAEYVNYKRRVDRDRAVVQERAVRDVLESMLGVLDDIHAAREHGDLDGGPFEKIADKLESTLGRYGLARFGAKGEAFDPQEHEALMHAPWPADDADLPAGAAGTTVVTVLQPGYRAGEQVLRPARVAVADPD
ncbi:nucleotide exchange factor GrpE [Phycicoccus sp. CSK15P-2]|nr:nucleotide exchange factor GrpE [Phycicoccus sp. CSK15P-2]